MGTSTHQHIRSGSMPSDKGKRKEIHKKKIIIILLFSALVCPSASEYSSGGNNIVGEKRCDSTLQIMKSVSGIEQPAAHESMLLFLIN